MVGSRCVTRELCRREDVLYLCDDCFRHVLLREQRCYIFLVEVGCRDREPVGEVGPRSALDLFVEMILVVRFECCGSSFEVIFDKGGKSIKWEKDSLFSK